MAAADGRHGPGTRLAGRVAHHATAYGAAAAATTVAGLVSVVVFTRFLEPAEFGKLAVLSTVATIVTMVATLGVMQGTMRRIYGTTGDEELGEGEERPREELASDPRLTLTTGLAIVLVFGSVLALGLWALREPLAGLLGDRAEGILVILAGAAGAVGGVMRFTRNMLRLQLRPEAYLAVTLVLSLGATVVAIPLLAVGLGIEAVLLGFLAANAAAAAAAISLLIGEMRAAVSLREAWAILTGGFRYLPLLFSFKSIQLGDTLLVAQFATFGDTGMYRVAQRIATPVTYGTSVFQQAWGPLRRDMTQTAVDRVDETRAYTAHLMSFYAVFVTALILSISVLADPLARLAASDYGEAATLVPLTTVSLAGHGGFILAYRNARLPKQMLWMIGLSLFAALLFGFGSALLIPALGAAGAPLAAIGGWGAATFAMLLANQLIGEPIPFEYRRLAALGGMALATWACAQFLLPDSTLGTAAKLALLVGWAAALLLTRIVPVPEVRALAIFARDSSGEESKHGMRAKLDGLEGLDALLVEEVVRRARHPHEVAERLEMSEHEVLACTVQALREAAGGGEPLYTDVAVGELILVPRPRAERDSGLLEIAAADADPIDADLLKRAAAAAAVTPERGRRRVRFSRVAKHSDNGDTNEEDEPT